MTDTDQPVDPVWALRRIAFLLERRLADSYRIKAYRGAAATLLTVDADEVRERARAGTLRQLPGVGAKTAGIVEECVAGQDPRLPHRARGHGGTAGRGRGGVPRCAAG